MPRFRDGLLDQSLGLSGHLLQIEPLGVLAALQAPALDNRGALLDGLVKAADPIDVGRDEYHRRHRLRAPHVGFEHIEVCGRVSRVRLFLVFTFPRRLGLKIFSARSTTITRRSPIIGSVRAAWTIASGDPPSHLRRDVRS